MLRLASGVALEERTSSVFQAIQHGLVGLGRIGHGNLRNVRRAVAGGERLGHTFLLDKLALRGDAKLVHIVPAKHVRAVTVLPAGVGVHLRVEH